MRLGPPALPSGKSSTVASLHRRAGVSKIALDSLDQTGVGILNSKKKRCDAPPGRIRGLRPEDDESSAGGECEVGQHRPVGQSAFERHSESRAPACNVSANPRVRGAVERNSLVFSSGDVGRDEHAPRRVRSWISEDRGGVTFLHDTSGVEHHDSLRDGPDDAHFVGDQQDCQAQLPLRLCYPS